MPLQFTVNLTQVEKVRLLHVTSLCPGGIQDRSSMALETEGKKSFKKKDTKVC